MSFFQFEIWLIVFVPGFLIAFLIGWRRKQKEPNILKIILLSIGVGISGAALVVGALTGLFFYMMGPGEVDHYSVSLTVQQAREQGCPIPLPDSARNVQFVVASGGLQAMEMLIRFTAPVDVCRNHVQTAFDAWAKQIGRPPHALSFKPLESSPPPEDHDMVGRASWFDVERIANGLTTESSISSNYNTQFWVDEDRGIFYCKITD